MNDTHQITHNAFIFFIVFIISEIRKYCQQLEKKITMFLEIINCYMNQAKYINKL